MRRIQNHTQDGHNSIEYLSFGSGWNSAPIALAKEHHSQERKVPASLQNLATIMASLLLRSNSYFNWEVKTPAELVSN